MARTLMLFLFGTLRYRPLLELVGGEVPEQVPASLQGWRVSGVEGHGFPVMVRDAASVVHGVVISPSAAALDRLVHYEDAFGYVLSDVTVTTGGAEHAAQVFVPPEMRWTPSGAWSLEDWAAREGARTLFFAEEIMGYHGRFSGAALQFRRQQAEGRAQARVQAASMAAPVVGWDCPADRVEVTGRTADHAGYFVTETVNLRHPRFGGGMSEEITREVFVAADAAIVLPYDPVRDRILLVEQFRMGPWRRGAAYPFMLEPVAGRIDSGETAEACARREAVEEAGLDLRELILIGSGYPTPGYSSEYFHVFAGICDLPDGIEGTHGQEDEHEDIRTHVLSWAQAEDLLSRGEADNMPLVLALVWLSRERSRLRGSG
jgi:nudix-type nucleoside diphosphatase (YffH/AdpP family)